MTKKDFREHLARLIFRLVDQRAKLDSKEDKHLIEEMVQDPTADQFNSKPDYSKGRGSGFLTRRPSMRAALVIRRVKSNCAINEPIVP